MARKEDVLYKNNSLNNNTNTENTSDNDSKSDSNKKYGKKKEQDKITKQDVIRFLLYVLAIFVVTFCILHFLGQRTRVSGSSMESTLSDGDNLIVDKLTYRFSDPERFDIIVFPYEGPGATTGLFNTTYYIKRIIGLPGETVWIDYDGNIYINGEKLEENYGLQKINNPGNASTPIVLGEDEYFVLGDNRNNSSDSRFSNVGPIKGSHLTGRALVRIFPFTKIEVLTGK